MSGLSREFFQQIFNMNLPGVCGTDTQEDLIFIVLCWFYRAG